jgi:hypothetical protein
MKYLLTGLPGFVTPDEYHAAIERMKNQLASIKSVRSVFRVGGISTPGISDIDFYVVFRDNTEYKINPVLNINSADRYLFTHNLFGTCYSLAKKMEKYTYFGNYDLIHGEPMSMNEYESDPANIQILKNQIALEYLIKAYLSISMGIATGVIKIRSLLLHAKALNYDLAFLNLTNCKLAEILQEILLIRNSWFKIDDVTAKIEKLIDPYHEELHNLISQQVASLKFYTGNSVSVKISSRIQMVNSWKIHLKYKGLIFPPNLNVFSSKFMKLQNRFVKWQLGVPLTTDKEPEILKERRKTIAEGIAYNNNNLPGFLCTAYPLNIFLTS